MISAGSAPTTPSNSLTARLGDVQLAVRCGFRPADGRQDEYFIFPLSPMGQYFKAVNVTKQEVVCPWCLHSGAKLWEWSANSIGSIFTLLLRKSCATGGGDYYAGGTQVIEMDGKSPKQLTDVIMEGVAREGRPVEPPKNSLVGRWAGDEVYLVGDYDSSNLYEESREFRNISRELVPIWNSFVELEDLQLEYYPDCTCQESTDS